MAKRTAATPRRGSDEDRADRRAAAEDAPKKAYRVRAGQTVTVGDPENEGSTITYAAGEEVELTDAEAKAMPWAVDTGERRARTGQNSRLKSRVKELEAEIERLKGNVEDQRKAKKDPGRQAAAESLKARGDNFMARNEPQIGSVPPDALDAHDRAVLAEEMGGDGDGGPLESDDELAGGMHGVARATAGGEGGSNRGGVAGTGAGGAAPMQQPGASTSQPFTGKPGESQRPGESQPSGGEEKK